jgi:cytochrome P450
MRSIHEIPMATLPVEDSAFAANPYPLLEAARRQHPWLAKCSYGYLIFGYTEIDDIYRMDDKVHFATDQIIEVMGARGSPWGNFNEGLMITKQGEEHARLRGNVADAFSPRNVNRFRQLMRETVSELLDEWATKRAFDFAEFAANFPIRVMCSIIGASPDVVPGIRKYLEVQGLSFSMDPDMLPAADEAISRLFEFVEQLVRERGPGGDAENGDLLDALIAANTRGLISSYELSNLLVFLFGAGYDTSKNMLTLIMYLMLERPDMYRRCGKDFKYARKVMKEALRYISVSNVPRTVVEEFVYRDVVFPRDTMLTFVLPLSGRDPRAYRGANEFNPDRVSANRHIAFGRGAHICLGQYLARVQIEEGLHLIAKRLKHPKLAGDIVWRPFPGVWGIKTLPLEFEPGN